MTMSPGARHGLIGALMLACACGDDGGRGASAGATGATGVTGATGLTTAGVTSVTGGTGDGGSATGVSGGGTEAQTSGGPGGTSDPSGANTTGGSGDCVSDEECPPGQECAPWSSKCVPTGGCIVNEDCDGGKVCEQGMCVIGGDCGQQAFTLTQKPVNAMIVLDRSGSMDGDVQNSNKNRWEVAKDAIFKLVDKFNAEIRFGLVTYSACVLFDECTAGKVVVPMGNLNAGPIKGFLGPKGLEYLCNTGAPETSTGNTLQALVGYGPLQDPAYTNAVILITDGNENSECQNNTNAAAAAGQLFTQPVPVRTFAVGFSDGVLGSLADVAKNGGTETPYNANDPVSLDSALDAIGSAVVSCDFVLDAPPDDPSKVYVFFNDDPAGVPNDPLNGWTYDPNTNTISFHGAACEALKDGTVLDVDVVFGCNIPIPG